MNIKVRPLRKLCLQIYSVWCVASNLLFPVASSVLEDIKWNIIQVAIKL